MSGKERARLEVFGRVRAGTLSVPKAAGLLGLSLRQARRVYKRFRAGGDAGLVHGLRGRASNRRTDDTTRAAVLALYRAKYHDFGPTLACEYLARDDGHELSPDTLCRWLRAEGLWGRKRRRARHRSRRPRRECRGELVQMDGSWHDWFEGRGGAGWCCLMALVDDATGTTWARFYERETLAAAFDAFGRYAAAYGLPRALYVDRAGIYRGDKQPTAEQRLAGEKPVTQFGRAMGELAVELVLANSPQAKGRVERRNAVFQDRLVKALRLAGVGTVGAANALLEASFLKQLNERFAVEPAGAADLHRAADGALPAGAADLSEVLCEREERAVGRDWCVQWRGRLLQIDKAHEALALAGRRVTVREKADGTLQVLWQGQALAWREAGRRSKPPKAKRLIVNNKRWVPPAEHPWKRRAPAARASSATPPQPVPQGPPERRG